MFQSIAYILRTCWRRQGSIEPATAVWITLNLNGEKTLAAHCSAINELRACLGEEDSLSELLHNENIVTFSVQTKANKLIRFHFQSENPVTYPSSPATLLFFSNVVEEGTLDLEALNAKLSHGPASLGKALSLLGRQLDVDLDWALEAVEIDGGGGESDDVGGASDGDSLDNMSEDEGMSDQDSDLLREWSRKMIQLEAIEQEKANDVPVETDHSNKQIFDTKAAFRRLLNELEEIFKAQDINLMVDTPSAEGLYQWEVYLAGFTPEKSNLAADLYQTGRRFGLSSVHLQINFKRQGLHPFYPPSVRLLSPRFKGPVLGAVASFPLLDPKHWDPITSAKDCILNIKRFLEENARVDLESSTQTYHPAEVLITRLSALTGIQPVDRNQSPDHVYASSLKKFKNAVSDLHHGRGDDEEELPKLPKLVAGVEGMLNEDPFGSPTKKVRILTSPTAEEAAAAGGEEEVEVEEVEATTSAGNNIEEYPIEKQEEALEPGLPEKVKQPAATAKSTTKTSAKPIAWKKGVGYGSGSNPKNKQVWDAKRAEALQDARDAELQDVLSFLLTTVEKVLTEETSMKEYDKKNDEEKCLVRSVLKTGCLIKILIKELSSVGFQGMVSRSGYYRTLLEWAQLLSLDSQVAEMLLWHAEDDGNGKCLAAAVSSLKAQASTFLKALGDQAAGSSEPEDDLKLATLLLKVADLVELAVAGLTMHTTSASTTASSTAQAAVAAATANGALTGPSNITAPHDTPMLPADAPTADSAAHHETEEESETQYVSIMSPFKVSLLPGISANHIFQSDASKEPTAPSRLRARRVASELASLEADLPITASSSVFVCADEQQTILWKTLITGPRGTPYEGGCFLFDIYFPCDYPDRAPSVKLRTTGGGTVRFNPNLYNCGKVCLSLLGTWQGQQGESWSAEYSSILQVLVSIQSLIFVDQPFYNEPGYESRPDDSQSNAYSAQIMEMTVKWAMIDQLKSPPEYFADAIRSHFRERGEVVLATVKRWEEWCRSIGASKSAAGIKKMLPELESEILKLKHE